MFNWIPRAALAATFALAASAAASPAFAQPTHVMVRARSLDAKFIGAHTGGVELVFSNSRTGAVLARGLITGGTGDTPRIMQTPQTRGVDLSDATTAGFDAVLDLSEPTLVKVEARGPMGRPASAISVSSMMWILPGHDVTGDGWVLTFPGLAIEPTAAKSPAGLSVSANVTMMCGCPISPGGVWDAARFTVEAQLLDKGATIARMPLSYGGKASLFNGEFTGVKPGHYVLRIIAAEAGAPNTGVVEQAVDF